MKKTLILNDLHLGVQRTGGTTILSAMALREYTHRMHERLLDLAVAHGCERVIVNGDLTDVYDIPNDQVLEVYLAAAAFLVENPGIELVWALGNHDLSKDSSRLGAVAFLGNLLQQNYPNQFTLISRATQLDPLFYVIPHVANQEKFDLELTRVPAGVKYLLLHCNYDNNFAVEQDHSLNLARSVAKEIVNAGTQIILGHEHQGRAAWGNRLLIVGNQFPTSVADCLGSDGAQEDGKKYALVIDGHNVTQIQTWSPDDAEGWYREVRWDEPINLPAGRGFVRVAGTATAAQAAEVIKVISRLRQDSPAFVVTNAVKVEGVDSVDELSATVEDIKQVNVIELLLAELTEQQQQVVKTKLLEEVQ